MDMLRTPLQGISLMCVIVLLAACGPSQESLEATATQAAAWQSMTQTAGAPTATLTSTPTPTSTPRPSPTPAPQCRIVSIGVVEGERVPTFELIAEGFLPGEGRYINVVGTILVDGVPQEQPTSLMGGGGESADSQGRIIQTIAFIYEEQVELLRQAGYEIEFLSPSEYSFTVGGYSSGCEASGTITWTQP